MEEFHARLKSEVSSHRYDTIVGIVRAYTKRCIEEEEAILMIRVGLVRTSPDLFRIFSELMSERVSTVVVQKQRDVTDIVPERALSTIPFSHRLLGVRPAWKRVSYEAGGDPSRKRGRSSLVDVCDDARAEKGIRGPCDGGSRREMRLAPSEGM